MLSVWLAIFFHYFMSHCSVILSVLLSMSFIKLQVQIPYNITVTKRMATNGFSLVYSVLRNSCILKWPWSSYLNLTMAVIDLAINILNISSLKFFDQIIAILFLSQSACILQEAANMYVHEWIEHSFVQVFSGCNAK